MSALISISEQICLGQFQCLVGLKQARLSIQLFPFLFKLLYILFLGMYTYISLVRTPAVPSFPELYVLSCMITMACELFRTFHALEPNAMRLKLR